MPPTIQTNGRAPERHEGRSRSGASEKRSDLVCKVKYNNQLPDIPFDPKFIIYPFESSRYVQYNPTSLERSYKFDLLTEHDLGVSIDLINPDTYLVDHDGYLAREDEELLEDESNVQMDGKRSRHHNKNVSWLRKTEYISTEYNRFTQSSQKAEARLGYSIKKNMAEEVLYKDRDSQIKAIKETFNCAKTPVIHHYSKPGVTAVEVLPMFPDFEMWKHPCAQVIFDSDPAQKGKSVASQNEEMSQAMIRGMVDEHGEQFVAYFLPTPETMEKRKKDNEIGVDYEDGEEYDYVLASEYNWIVKNKASRGYEENYFFVMKDDGIYYNELETRVRLSKRRKVGATAASTVKSRLVVKHRPLTEQELAQQDARVMMLEPPGEEGDELMHRPRPTAMASDDENESQRQETSPTRSVASPAGSEASRGGSDKSPVRGSPAASDRSPARSESGSERSVPGSPAGNDRSPAGSHSPSASPRSEASGGSRSSRKRSRDSSPASGAGSAPGSPQVDDEDSERERQQNEAAEIFGSEPDDD